MGYNKIIYGGKVLIDLTGDTVTAAQLKKGITAHDKSGAVITGTCEHDVNSGDATVGAAEMLYGKTAYARGAKITGTMRNNGAISYEITSKSQKIIVPIGYHDGSGTVTIDDVEQAKLVPANIRNGITILGVTGTMTGTEGAIPQAKTVTPSTAVQRIVPDSGYNYLSQVTVNAIPYNETQNSAGGTTVTIA